MFGEVVPVSIWRTCNRIRTAIFRVGFNFWKYFKALDTAEDGVISEAQFISILAGPLKSTIALSDQEISEIINYFRVQDGRITYSNFCEVIHGEVPNFSGNEPLTTGLEWNDPYHVNKISNSEEKQLQILLTKIAISLNTRFLVLHPYFQDYELIAKGNGTVTVSHFARVLHFLGILLSTEEFSLLVKRFMKDGYCINYVAFLTALSNMNETVDKHNLPGYGTNSLCEKLTGKERVKNQFFGLRTSFHPAAESTSTWKRHYDFNKTMGRIQRHALSNRIRTGDFFKDFDTMKCGKINVAQFRRGLDAFGISGIHHLYLSELEIYDLCNVYRDPNDPSLVCWKAFEDDVDLIFTTKNLEKCPSLRVKKSLYDKIESIPNGTSDWNSVDGKLRILCEDVVQKLKMKIITHRLNIKTHFRDYDRLNNGHVTIPQFRQCLVYYGFLLSAEEINAIEVRYHDDMGFNYMWFLKEVEPNPIEDPLYDDFIKEKILLNSKKMIETPSNKEKDIAAIVAKLKSKVVCEGIRVIDFFADYDKLNKQVISKDDFERGLSLCNFKLSNIEVKTLCNEFTSPLHGDHIDYRRFCSIVESSCATPGLERKPLFVPVKHVPPSDSDCSFLNAEERKIVDGALLTLASKSIYDLNLLPCFQDFDPTNCGSVTKSHFMRVMALRNLSNHLSSKQLDILVKCFQMKRGSAHEVDYRAFCKSLDILIAISPNKIF